MIIQKCSFTVFYHKDLNNWESCISNIDIHWVGIIQILSLYYDMIYSLFFLFIIIFMIHPFVFSFHIITIKSCPFLFILFMSHLWASSLLAGDHLLSLRVQLHSWGGMMSSSTRHRSLLWSHCLCWEIVTCTPVMRSIWSLILSLPSLIARFIGPTWGPSGADRTQVGPMLTPWTLLSGLLIAELFAIRC